MFVLVELPFDHRSPRFVIANPVLPEPNRVVSVSARIYSSGGMGNDVRAFMIFFSGALTEV